MRNAVFVRGLAILDADRVFLLLTFYTARQGARRRHGGYLILAAFDGLMVHPQERGLVVISFSFGESITIPVPGGYDDDRRTDIFVFRPLKRRTGS